MLFSRVSLSVLLAAGLYLAAHASPLAARDDTQLLCARNYTVIANDTCNSISAAQNVSTFQLVFDNPAVSEVCDNLQAGQNLCLGFEGQDCTTVQAVTEGDNCNAIAMIANITLATLLGNNPNVNANCTNIIPEEVLCTASQLIPYDSA